MYICNTKGLCMKKAILYFSFFTFHFSFVFASRQRPDSLRILISHDKTDTARENHMNALCLAYCASGNTDSAMAVSKRALVLAQKLNDLQGVGDAYNGMATTCFSIKDYTSALSFFHKAMNSYKRMGPEGRGKSEGAIACIGFIYESQGDYNHALEFYNRSLQMARSSGDKKAIAIAIGNLGNVYSMQGDDAKAMDCYLKSLSLKQQAGDKEGVAKSASNIGRLYKNQGDYVKAMQFYQTALSAALDEDDKYMQAATFINIGNIYREEGESKTALDYAYRALKLSEELHSKPLKSSANSAVGLAFWSMANYSKALEYYNTALKQSEETGDKSAQATILGNIGIVCETQGDFPKALDYEFRSLKLSKEIGDKNGITISTGNIGNIYIKQKHYKEAESYILQALYLADTIHLLESVKASNRDLSELFAQTGQWQKALDAYKQYAAASDSLNKATKNKMMEQVQAKAAFEQAQALQNIKSQQEAAIEKMRSKYHKIIWALVGFVLLAFATGIYILFRLKILKMPPEEPIERPKIEEAENKEQ